MWVLKTSPWVGTAKQGKPHRNSMPLQARRWAKAAVREHLGPRCAPSNSAPMFPGEL